MRIKLLMLSIFSTTAFANNAILNVEGQIQINGQQVISSDGKIATSALPVSSGVLVDLNKYNGQPGIYTYEYINEYHNGWEVVRETCTNIDNYISENSYEYSSECIDNQNNISNKWKEIWSYDNQGNETIVFTWYDPYSDEEVTNTRVNKLEVFSEYDSQVILGTKTSFLERTTVISSDDEWYQTGDSWLYARTKSVAGFIDAIDLGGNTYNDCILLESIRNRGDSSLDIYCAGLGLVAKTSEVGHHLKSFEPYSQRSAYSARNLSTSINDRNLADKARERKSIYLLKTSN